MMTRSDERLEILEMIQQGKISPEEGLKLIEALSESWEEEDQEYLQAKEEMLYPPPPADREEDPAAISSEEMQKYRR